MVEKTKERQCSHDSLDDFFENSSPKIRWNINLMLRFGNKAPHSHFPKRAPSAHDASMASNVRNFRVQTNNLVAATVVTTYEL